MAELLADRPPEEFLDVILEKLPPPVAPDTVDEEGNFVPGEKMWEWGMRLSPEQRAPLVCPARFVQDAGGWRSGKSLRGALKILVDIFWRSQVRGRKDDLYGVVAVDYEQAKETMRHLSQLLSDLGVPHEVKTPDSAQGSLTFPHMETRVISVTAHDPTKIAGKPYRGIVITEANQCKADVKDMCRGRVSETRGWLYLEGTFETQYKGPWYARQWFDWQQEGAEGVSFSVPSWANLVRFPGGRTDPEILHEEKWRAPDVFMERYGGVPLKRSDLVMKYADERFHVAHLYPRLSTSFDPDRPVYLFSDPGTAHAYAVFAVQFWRGMSPGNEPGTMMPARRHGHGNVCWIIDAVYRWGRSAHEIIQECAQRPWSHNAEVSVMDVAARQRRTEGEPVVQQWSKYWLEETGRRIHVYTQPVPLHPGYDIHRLALLNSWPEEDAQRAWNSEKTVATVTNPEGPRLMVDPKAAAPLFGGMVDGQRYEGEYNLHRYRRGPDNTILSDEPIDVDNDAIKAINYGLYWYFGPAGARPEWIGRDAVPWEMSVA
ncbi:MAG: hypothetical protein ACOC5K_01070 [Chloroflexota bacterium]